MKRWYRDLALYAPAIALLVAGVVVLLTSPLMMTVSCTCSGYDCVPCPAEVVWHPAGLFLLAGAGSYALVVFGWLRARPLPHASRSGPARSI